MPEELKSKVALVTGASRGIGRSIAVALAERGASIALNYTRNEAAAKEVADLISKFDVGVKLFKFDVGNSTEVNAAISEIITSFGSLDILVNNAGIADDALLIRATDESWKRTLDTNLAGAFYCARAAAKPMMKARWGRIINISSVIGEMGNAGQSAYAAAKAGMIGLTKSLAKELSSRGITVNAVTPGYIETDMTSGIKEDYKEKLLSQIPLGRLGTSEDVAAVVSFLASPLASYITGEVVAVNGGLHM